LYVTVFKKKAAKRPYLSKNTVHRKGEKKCSILREAGTITVNLDKTSRGSSRDNGALKIYNGGEHNTRGQKPEAVVRGRKSRGKKFRGQLLFRKCARRLQPE
jgi:hypothetical protein